MYNDSLVYFLKTKWELIFCKPKAKMKKKVIWRVTLKRTFNAQLGNLLKKSKSIVEKKSCVYA